MSVSLPQELFRKTSTNSQEALEPSSSGDIPDGRFRDLLRVLPIDENPREKNLFELVEEKDEEKLMDGPASVQISLNPIPSPPEKKTEKTERADAFTSPYLSSAFSSNSTPDLTVTVIQRPLSSEIAIIFEKMAASMIVMSSSGEIETTLFLDNPASIFYGTKITIREFSTAPKAFNVEITSFTPAINAIESGRNDLLSAFQNGNFNFSIHRFETFIHSEERPVLHRKGSSDDDNQERKGGREE
jgi:hypothetical protein